MQGETEPSDAPQYAIHKNTGDKNESKAPGAGAFNGPARKRRVGRKSARGLFDYLYRKQDLFGRGRYKRRLWTRGSVLLQGTDWQLCM